ncbi:MAG: hypothetical protein QME96_18935 [Myxococcota bacterium]|nr:hypothetical protein [Myxococcota bacterium]
MAQMLQDDDSTAKHIEQTRRHQRRCRRTKGAADFASRIEAVRAALEQADQETWRRTKAEQDARDDLELADGEQDDEVITTSDRASEYDRDNPGQRVHELLFPTGRRSDVTDESILLQPDEVEIIAGRIEGLGEAHPLFPRAASLRGRATASRNAVRNLGETLRQRKLAEADEEMAQAALRRAYEANYLDARKTLGKRIAERLFPRIQRRKPPAPGAPPPD